jgi:hypothetical protein
MIEPWQAKKLHDKIGPMVAYLHRLQNRMEETGRNSGKLYELVRKAHLAIHTLSMDLHYISCESGVSRPGER